MSILVDRYVDFIATMAREWMDSTDATEGGGDRRLAVLPSYLKNELGLTVEKDWHYCEDGTRRRLYHLPQQSREQVEMAVRRLKGDYIRLAHSIRMLAARHPRADGSRPAKPGIGREAWSAIVRQMPPRESHQRQALDILLEPGRYLTVAEFDERFNDQRLPEYVRALKAQGHDIVAESRSADGGKARFAAYRLFTTDEERALYDAEQARARIAAERTAAALALKKAHASEATKLTRAAVARFKRGKAMATPAVAPVAERRAEQEPKAAVAAPAHVLERLQNLSRLHRGNNAMSKEST